MDIKTSMNILLENTRKIYKMLADKESQEIYVNRIMYFMTGDPCFIKKLAHTYVDNFLSPDLGGFPGLLGMIPRDRKFVFFGAGKDGAHLLEDAKYKPNFLGFCSSTKAKQENGYEGFPVMSPEELLARKDLYVVITTSDARNEVKQILREGGYPQELIIDAPPVYKPGLGTAEQYFGPKFMKFEEREVFVDAGCYDLGSTLQLGQLCKRMKVYAFEPDSENYQKCLENKKKKCKYLDLSEVKILPYATWGKREILNFYGDGSGSSRICEGNPRTCSVSAMPIDEVIDPGDRVTMIKMDVEGAELESLKGAKETIRRDRPKLAVCIYHKPEDLWEIPLYIHDLVPEYRLYIRHHTFWRNETVLYAVLP